MVINQDFYENYVWLMIIKAGFYWRRTFRYSSDKGSASYSHQPSHQVAPAYIVYAYICSFMLMCWFKVFKVFFFSSMFMNIFIKIWTC